MNDALVTERDTLNNCELLVEIFGYIKMCSFTLRKKPSFAPVRRFVMVCYIGFWEGVL